MLTRRALLTMGAAAAAGTAVEDLHLSALTFEPAVKTDPLGLVNPEFLATFQQFMKTSGSSIPPLTLKSLPAFRSMVKNWAQPLLSTPDVSETMIPGHRGAPKVRVYVTGNAPGASKPAVLHMHGGGYVSGAASFERRAMQQLALDHDCVVVSVDYRLAPETAFPGSLEDNYAALRWINTNAKELGIDVTRIAVKGESAGGGHAAALAIIARDRREFHVRQQVLIYPMLDDRTGSTRKMPLSVGQIVWTANDNVFGWTSLLGVAAGSKNVPRNSVPSRIEDYSGLAPAFIGVGSIDLFAPEGIAFARSLLMAGVPTELMVVPGAMHGFDLMVPQASLSKQFTAAWNAALRRAFTKK